ncbi:MAG: hypothetical protein ACK4PC_03560 [Sphingopyxis sp.]
MTFAPLASHDWPGIAAAEAARRARAAGGASGMTEAQRRSDAAEWAAIVEWARWLTTPGRPLPLPGEGLEEAEYLARITLRTARTALAKWHADRQPGEPEARAFKLLYLARRFARLVGNPEPTVDAAGAILFPAAPAHREAA